ncbi:hypothetical protein RNZ50_06445 [Paracoccaceae bacterium Fryx2]|nr:hypothetical protein [Paracoccaceae bacterium Fryx2]
MSKRRNHDAAFKARVGPAATTLDAGFVAGMRSFPGTPCDGHPLKDARPSIA